MKVTLSNGIKLQAVTSIEDTQSFSQQWGIPESEAIEINLDLVKKSAVERLYNKADEYQAKFLGSNSPERQARFQRNLIMAKAAIAGIANSSQLSALTTQCAANVLKAGLVTTPPVTTEERTTTAALFAHENESGSYTGVEAFAHWVADWEPKTDLISGEIEGFLVNSRTMLMQITAVEQIEPFIDQIAEQAEQQFAALAG